MGIPLFNEIEKLINEHGSAVILKERLALAADQYAALERKIIGIETRTKISELRAEQSELNSKQFESENKSLRFNLEKAEEKIRCLEKELIGGHANTFEEVQVKIMAYIAQEKSTTVKDIANYLNAGESVIQFHLEELKMKHIVSSQRVPLVGEMWALEQLGRKYLIQNNLIK